MAAALIQPAWQADALSALVKLVRQEYPERLPLVEIAATWGDGISEQEIAALAILDAQEPK